MKYSLLQCLGIHYSALVVQESNPLHIKNYEINFQLTLTIVTDSYLLLPTGTLKEADSLF